MSKQFPEDKHTCNFELPNGGTPDNSPIGYPNMAEKDPHSVPKMEPPKRKYVYHQGPVAHSVNPQGSKRYLGASMSELQRMKLAK